MDQLGLKERVDVIKRSIFDDPERLLKMVWPEILDIVQQIDRIDENTKKIPKEIQGIVLIHDYLLLVGHKLDEIMKSQSKMEERLIVMEERTKAMHLEDHIELLERRVAESMH